MVYYISIVIKKEVIYVHHILIKNLGPINECSIDIDQFTFFTGAQASGKSTIAKSIFFFRTVKDDIEDIIIRRGNNLSANLSLYKIITNVLRNKFLQLFGSSRAMSNELFLQYNYDSDTYISITLKMKKGDDYVSPNYVFLEFSNNIKVLINKYTEIKELPLTGIFLLKGELNCLFCDECETIFIPAGRSLITLLTAQLNYIFTIMDDEQRYSIDFCTQKYVERILKIRNTFNEGIVGFLEKKNTTGVSTLKHYASIRNCIKIVDKVLKGRYKYVSGEERLEIENGRYVKINYTSSGQQESVWIFNILLYQLINNTKTFIILEEPEAHLYPNAQKDIIDLLSIFINCGNSLLLTTHSPYILGAANNLLLADSVQKNIRDKNKITEIVSEEKIIHSCSAYFVSDGKIDSCFDITNNLIKNEVIEGASNEINDISDRLIELENEET